MGLLDKLFPPPSPDRFAQLMIKALRDAGVPYEFRYDRETFSIISDEPQQTLGLGNAYNDYRETPRKYRRQVLAHYAVLGNHPSRELSSDYAEAKTHLLPRIRSRSFYESLPYLFDKKEAFIPHRVLADHLGVEVIYDLPTTTASVNEGHLKDWGVTFEDALATARENLWKISNENFIEIQPGLYHSPWQDSHGSARLFLHDLIWQLEVKGRHVVLAPNREGLLVTGTEDAEGLRIMAKLGEDLVRENRAISGIPVVLDGKEWRTYRHGEDGTDCPDLQKLCMMWEAQEYGEQKERLDKRNAEQGEDVFVATVMLAGNEQTGELRSIAVWGKGIETLLPKTTHVAIMTPREETEGVRSATVRWENAVEVAGDLMQPCGMYPERYRLKAFPTPEQIKRMNPEEK